MALSVPELLVGAKAARADGDEARARDMLIGVVQGIGPTDQAVHGLEASFILGQLGDAEAELDGLRNMATVFPDSADVLARLAWLLHRAGHSAQALPHQERALTLQGLAAPVSAHMIRANMLNAAGQTGAAIDALRDLARHRPDDLDIQGRLAWLLHQAGHSAEALPHQERALALQGDAAPVSAHVIRANMLNAAGQTDAAIAALHDLAAQHPDNADVPGRLAWLLHQSGRSAEALPHQERALALQGDAAPVSAHVIHANMLNAAGQQDRALAVLHDLAERFPGDLQVEHLLAERLLDQKDFDAAIARLEALNKANDGGHAATVLLLVRAYRSAGMLEAEVDTVTAALQTHSRDIALLRHIFLIYPRMGTQQEVAEGLNLLRARLKPAEADDLEALMLLQTLDFARALPMLRRTRRGRRNLTEAQRMVWALFGSHHYRLGMRYVRFCLRRWPRDPVLWTSYIRNGFRLGRMAETAQAIETAAAVLPEHLVLGFRHMQCGYTEDFPGAVDCYEQLQRLNKLAPENRDLQTMLMFNLCNPAEFEPVFARIGHPRDGDDRLLHRSGLPGMMALEFDLERQAMQEAGGYDSPADWVRKRPGAPMAAIHLIDDWRRQRARITPGNGTGTDGKAPTPAPIPRTIYQYWHMPQIPESLQPMVDSWAQVPGFTHQVIDRAAAQRFLRETMGPNWVRAFHLAENPAQEADLFRLCQLAHSGGVYADIDDVLHGSLDALLDQGQGLILYRESLGGAVGNNFIAVPPRHPVIVYAARLARTALLQRSVELAWTKTGPGLLTRAVAQYILQADPGDLPQQLTLLEWEPFARHVSTHNPALYKEHSTYWGNAQKRRPEARVWERLLTALRDSE